MILLRGGFLRSKTSLSEKSEGLFLRLKQNPPSLERWTPVVLARNGRCSNVRVTHRAIMQTKPIDSEHFRRLACIELETDEQIAEYVEAVLHGELLHVEHDKPTHPGAQESLITGR